ncbi:MAG: sugar transferase [Nitrospirae bacterium]|nr:sugar transferase [Nitrospirota bacterium]
MIKEQNRIFQKVQLLCDLFLVVIAFFAGYYLRDKALNIFPINLFGQFLRDENLRTISYYAIYIGLLPVILLIWGSLLSYFGMYKSSGVTKIPDAMLILFKTTVIGFVLFGSYVFILRMQEDISRLFIGLTFFSAAALICMEKIALYYSYKSISRRITSFKSALFVFRRILIVGASPRVSKFISLIDNNPEWGIKIFALLDIDPANKGKIIQGHKVIGSLNELSDIIHNNVIDEVVFIVPRTWLNKIEDKLLLCESVGMKVYVAVDLFNFKFSRTKQTDLHGFPLLGFESTPDKLGHLFVKRLVDFVVAGIGLIMLFPFFSVVAVAIKLTSDGPVFFKQLRCGLYGRKFMFYKFRTMIVDAEEKLKELLKYNEMTGPVFKMTNDPRITKVGKWLRKFSIDELPQLWNVLKGDMSLVGPRPPLVEEVEKYDTWQRRRLSMRPGITCFWQISGRNEINDFREWMKLDLEYIDNWSLWVDFKIIFKTVPAVFLGSGAK